VNIGPGEFSRSTELEIVRKQGMLLYGVNASGKSCYMKSIGIALIMA
jgi:DNA mismatch repair ATPase MutS